MALWTNIIFAWIALVISFFLIVIWALRLICKNKKPSFLYKINRWLRHHHKLIGILLIIAGTVHGLFSSDALFGLNLGTAAWVLSILLGVNWLFRKRMKKMWMTYHRILTAVFIALVVIHIISVGGFILDDMIAGNITPPEQIADAADTGPTAGGSAESPTVAVSEPADSSSSNSSEPSATESSTAAESTAPIYDGTYTGTGTGYRPGLVVEVVIENGRIASVTVVEQNEEHVQIYGPAIEQIPDAIVDAQSTDVDSISGATKTSEGIKEAVEDALSQALAD
ncbi:MAG: FMN-binding protein [Eubacteriales bacterium]|nr:FMN-binding protein [Eubacteriales bacterium]